MISIAIILAEPSSNSGAGLSAFLLLPEWTPVLALNPNPFSSFAMQLCPALGQPKPKTACKLMEHGWGLHPAGLSSFSAPSASCYLLALRHWVSIKLRGSAIYLPRVKTCIQTEVRAVFVLPRSQENDHVWGFGPDECCFSMRPYQSKPLRLHPYLLEWDAECALLTLSFSRGTHGICNTLPSFQRNVVYIK